MIHVISIELTIVSSPDIEKAFDGVLFKIRDLISHQIGAVNARGFSITVSYIALTVPLTLV